MQGCRVAFAKPVLPGDVVEVRMFDFGVEESSGRKVRLVRFEVGVMKGRKRVVVVRNGAVELYDDSNGAEIKRSKM